MQTLEFKKAADCVNQYGVKILAFGGPGCGKTPIVKTAPNPILCATEAGLLSLKDWDGPIYEAYTPKAIDDFFDWLENSNEPSNFDTVAIDSVSQMAEIYLADFMKKNKDGRRAYGLMSSKIMEHVTCLYFTKYKHVYLTAKEQSADEGGGVYKKRPYFPGSECNIKIPHLYDLIAHVGTFRIPNVVKEQRAIATLSSFNYNARDRSGKLDEFEPCDLTHIINKIIS